MRARPHAPAEDGEWQGLPVRLGIGRSTLLVGSLFDLDGLPELLRELAGEFEDLDLDDDSEGQDVAGECERIGTEPCSSARRWCRGTH